MANVIAIMNEKGGVGKTATATTLAYLLAKRGFKTALIDFDGQGHASQLYGIENLNGLDVTISTLINSIIEDEDKPLPAPESYIIKSKGIDLIPANSELFMLERNLSKFDFSEYTLSKYVNTIKCNYEYIILDCMPQIGKPMVNAMLCADSIVIPTQSEILSAQGLTELLKHYHSISKNCNKNIKIAGILITMDRGGTRVSKKVNSIIEDTFAGKINIFGAKIPRSTKVPEACLYQMTVCEFAPKDPAAIAYEMFTKELIENGAA